MSRFGGDEEGEMPYELWRANAMRAIGGKPGQRALRDLEAALEGLPKKRLISGHLANQGEVCTVGALVLHRRMTAGEERAAILAQLESLAPPRCGCGCRVADHENGTGKCSHCAANAARRESERARLEEAGTFDERHWWPSRHCTAYEDSGESDDYGDVTTQVGQAAGLTFTLAWELAYANDERFGNCTPEERYDKVLAWVREAILPDVVAA